MLLPQLMLLILLMLLLMFAEIADVTTNANVAAIATGDVASAAAVLLPQLMLLRLCMLLLVVDVLVLPPC